MDGENCEQYNQVLGSGGFLIIDEEGKSAFLVAQEDSTYSVAAYLNL